MRIDQMTDRGLREGRQVIAESAPPLRVRAEDAEHRAEVLMSEANSLRRLTGMLALLDETYRAEQDRRAEAMKKEGDK